MSAWLVAYGWKGLFFLEGGWLLQGFASLCALGRMSLLVVLEIPLLGVQARFHVSPLLCALLLITSVEALTLSSLPIPLTPNQSSLPPGALVLAHRIAATGSTRLRWNRGGCLAQANVRLEYVDCRCVVTAV